MFWRLDPTDLQPGQRVDGWLIIQKLGSGGHGVVYEVEKDGKRFALKVACQVDPRMEPKLLLARAQREVACLQQLNHRYIIRMWAHGRWPDPRSGSLYIVVDLVEGYTLGAWVRRTYPTLHEVVVLFMKLFEALEHMHGRGVFHRDLSLRNIMVTREGEPVIIDFGAADYAAAEELTDAPLPPCTPRNRSPEAMLFWRENRLNPQARYPFKPTDDVFALGADLYDVLTDPTPDLSADLPVLNGAVPPSSPFKATQGRVPLELSSYVMMLLAPSLEERPATAKDARRPLEEFAQLAGPEWRGIRVHPVAAQLPPERAELAHMPMEAEQPGGEELLHPSALEGEVGAAVNRARPGWLHPSFLGRMALLVLAAAVAAALPHQGAHDVPRSVAVDAPATQPPPSAALAEKPTNRPARLPSPLPTHQEERPTVQQPENSPKLTRDVPPPQQAGSRRVLSKLERCALLVFTVAWAKAGCAGVQTRPDPEACPKGAVDAMEKELGWDVDGYVGERLFVTVDVTKGKVPKPLLKDEDAFTVFKDGPVMGALSLTFDKAPAGTRLEGHLWITGDRIYGRYRRAHLPDGRTVPICVELGQLDVGVEKGEYSKPGYTVFELELEAIAVPSWR